MKIRRSLSEKAEFSFSPLAEAYEGKRRVELGTL